MENQIKCPKCNGTQLIANKKGFSGGKALAGAVLTGGVGLLAGTIGSNDIVITCLQCGNQWEPGNTGPVSQGASESATSDALALLREFKTEQAIGVLQVRLGLSRIMAVKQAKDLCNAYNIEFKPDYNKIKSRPVAALCLLVAIFAGLVTLIMLIMIFTEPSSAAGYILFIFFAGVTYFFWKLYQAYNPNP